MLQEKKKYFQKCVLFVQKCGKPFLGVWVAAASLWPVRAHYVLTFGTERPKGGEKSAHRKHKEKKFETDRCLLSCAKKGCESSKGKKSETRFSQSYFGSAKDADSDNWKSSFFPLPRTPKKENKRKGTNPFDLLPSLFCMISRVVSFHFFVQIFIKGLTNCEFFASTPKMTFFGRSWGTLSFPLVPKFARKGRRRKKKDGLWISIASLNSLWEKESVFVRRLEAENFHFPHKSKGHSL